MITDNAGDFFTFEKKYSLFELQDVKGNYIWDIFRYNVYSTVYNNYTCINSPKKKRFFTNLFTKSKLIFIALYAFLPVKKNNLFFLASRNMNNGKFFDQQAIDVIEYIGYKQSYLYETITYYNLLYRCFITGSVARSLYFKLSKKLDYTVDENVINTLITYLSEYYQSIKFDKEVFYNLYIKFYQDLDFYTWLLKRHEIQRVFITQNGIQKGLFFAARKLNLPVYEFQHGIVHKNHPAYSYPDNIADLSNKIIIPDTIFSLSKYWFSDFYCPIKVIPIGNNHFFKCSQPKITNDTILVISASLFGHALAKVIKEVSVLLDRSINYKLHPNEFGDREFYSTLFTDGNVNVITNELSVSELLTTAKVLITVCSTASYEALQNGTPVILYKHPLCFEMSNLFNVEGVYLCKYSSEIIDRINGITSIEPVKYFDELDYKKLENILNDNNKKNT